MKTEQEQIEKLAQLIGRIKDDCENCDCKSCEVNGEDCCCVHYICATFLVDAGYGDVSEYKAEIERLKSNNGFLQCVISHSKDMLDEAVKQAQIDVLNKLKERIKTAIDTYFNLDGGGYYLAEGAIDDIDGLIEEVENGKIY